MGWLDVVPHLSKPFEIQGLDSKRGTTNGKFGMTNGKFGGKGGPPLHRCVIRMDHTGGYTQVSAVGLTLLTAH